MLAREYTGRLGIVVLLAAFAGILAACGGSQTPTSTPVASPTIASEGTPGPVDEEWQALIAAAQAEGQLVAVGGDSGGRSAMFEEFGEKFGIDIIHQGGSSGDLADRVFAEYARDIHEVDVVMAGSGTMGRYADGGMFSDAMPLLLDRDNVIDRSANWMFDEFVWFDETLKYNPAYTLTLVPNIANIEYNTERVSQAELDSIQSFNDFLKPEWRGRLAVMLDPDAAGGTSDRTLLWMRAGGPSFFEPLIRDQEVTFVDRADITGVVDGLARGQYDVVLFHTGEIRAETERAAALGLPVASLDRTLSEGALAGYRGQGAVYLHPAHPNAAKLWLNWLLSKEGQTVYQETVTGASEEPSMRTDVPQGITPDDVWEMRSKVTKDSVVDQTAPEFIAARDEVPEWLRMIYREIGGIYGY